MPTMTDSPAQNAPSRTAVGRRRAPRTTLFTALAVGVALVIAGCSTTSEQTTSQTSHGAQPAATTATGTAPAGAALKPIDPVSFQAAVDAAAEELLVPGAVVQLRAPQGNFDAVVGTTELGAQTPPDGHTHFRIASNTKTMTAALIVLLAQDGKLEFGDPVSAYVSDVPNGENITVAELLTMRSGLYNYTNSPEFAATLDADPAKAWTPREVLDIAFRQPPEFPPGTSYEYSNTNYAVLGLIAEKVGGRPLAEQFRDRLFGPLGLQQTSLPAADDAATIPDRYSHGYMYGGSSYAMVDEEYPADMQAAARAGTLQPLDYTHQNSSYATAAGGAISTADDLTTWIRALVSGDVLNAEYQQQWLHSLQPEDPSAPDGQQYGYGISYQRFGPNASMYYHGGELPGFNSFIGYDPDNDVTLVIWTNLTLSPEGKTTANALLPTVLDEIYAGLSLAPTPAPTTTR
ncbi:D-alanyl-D-alanine carboxypeptidase [Rhodococcus wratislaviensis]|uniref:Serine-type D-Ala-D-Ala carboxypeptidase n=2 Tax=Rhodococcus wratislaviensis TaxID=44752 RepID=A0AB38F5Z7_RHOWR|nr:D-alanyl-D-alanine carboxypeptidase [Rhodococcus wratislaviensis]SPZ34420.1 serine-type D-Ala-D-Ala carboxypeptidase [Rhodococcus wratislaviensis]